MNQFALAAVTAAISMFLSPIASAGWTSGGGHLRTTEQNPWFVQNTKSVSYCIDIDELNFGQTRDIAKSKILSAISYWQHQFSIVEPWDNEGTKVVLGSQQFVEMPCGPRVDVAFQFGVLTNEQEQFLKEPTAIVGIAVRTAYDEVQLRGKGFIYIAPEHGRLALRGNDLQPHRWSLNGGKLLELMLIHELGHVFGMPHVGDAWYIMGESFPDALARNESGRIFASALGTPSFFGGLENQGVDYCDKDGVGTKVEQIFGVPSSWRCLKISASKHGFEVHASEAPGHPFRLIGKARSSQSSGEGTSVSQLALPDVQRVFPNVPTDKKSLYLYSRNLLRNSATFVNEATQANSQIVVTRTPESVLIDGAAGESPILLEVINESTWKFNYNRFE